MIRMDQFRGRLYRGDALVFEPAEGYIASLVKRDGRKTWFGHIVLGAGKQNQILHGVPYRLVLDDGREGQIYADVHAAGQSGGHIAEFEVSGSFHERGRNRLTV